MVQAPTNDQETAHKATPQSEHQKAAEHHELASKHHKEAANLVESGDQKAAPHHALIAHAHTAYATEQGTEASKKYASTQGLQK
jgi:hypothetical protein